jgi:hypothetical protein
MNDNKSIASSLLIWAISWVASFPIGYDLPTLFHRAKHIPCWLDNPHNAKNSDALPHLLILQYSSTISYSIKRRLWKRYIWCNPEPLRINYRLMDQLSVQPYFQTKNSVSVSYAHQRKSDFYNRDKLRYIHLLPLDAFRSITAIFVLWCNFTITETTCIFPRATQRLQIFPFTHT